MMSRVMSDTGALQSVISNATAVHRERPRHADQPARVLMWQQPKLTLYQCSFSRFA